MKKAILAALLCIPILAGCTAAAAPSLPSRLSPTKETENDILRCYPLDSEECRSYVFGEDLYLIYPDSIRKYTGKQLICTGEYPLVHPCRVSISEGGAAAYDPTEHCVVLLSSDLTEYRRLELPGQVQGTPLLCSGGNHLYFCAASSLVCLDCNTGICRTVRQGIAEDAEVTGLLEEDKLILCTSGNETSYLSAIDGSKKAVSPPVTSGMQMGSRACLNVRCGENECLYLETAMLPINPGMAFLAFAPAYNAALVFRKADASLILYDLTTGNQLSLITLGDDAVPTQACSAEDGRIFILQQGRLLQWMPENCPARDPAVSISQLYTADAPNRKGLEQCHQRAAFLEQQYGFQISLAEDNGMVLPAGVQTKPEHITAFIRYTLDQVEQGLLRLPSELIREAIRGTKRTTVCILRSICVDGMPVHSYSFWIGNHRYILLSAGEGVAEETLRAVYPLIDAGIFSRSAALDQWEQGILAENQNAMEDRADVLLAAISPNNRELFCDAILQRKLRILSQGIREAFPTVKEKGSLPWEQYLW